MKRVLVIGATGNLGSLIARSALDNGALLRVLVRPGSRGKLAANIASGVEVEESEAEAFKDVDVVISAVQGGPETIIDAQLHYLRAAREAGVRRFIPSDFSLNFFNLADGENINSDWRRAFARHADEERGGMEVVHVLNGAFIDRRVVFGFLGAIDLDNREAYLWGDGQARMQFTTYADTAAYTAAAALDNRPVPDTLAIAGDSLTFHELVAETAAGLGVPIAVRTLGTLGDLDAEIIRRQQASPDNVFAWLPLMYWRAMLNGKGDIEPLMNARYPAIRPIRVREYVESLRSQ